MISSANENSPSFALVGENPEKTAGCMEQIASSSSSQPLINQHTPTATNAPLDTATTALKDIAFGSFAGVVGKVIEYPFDTVKVRLQAQPDVGGLRYTGPLDCFRQALKSDGVRGLYRGLSVPLLGAAAETSSLFFSVCLLEGRYKKYGANWDSIELQKML
jgi:ornithine carrier protein